MPLERVKQIIKDQLNVPDANITLGSSFDKDLSADDLDMIEIIIACEDVFQVDLDLDPDFSKLKTVGKLVDVIAECIKNAPAQTWFGLKKSAPFAAPHAVYMDNYINAPVFLEAQPGRAARNNPLNIQEAANMLDRYDAILERQEVGQQADVPRDPNAPPEDPNANTFRRQVREIAQGIRENGARAIRAIDPRPERMAPPPWDDEDFPPMPDEPEERR